MITSRRSFLTGLVSFIAAPAIIKVADLMPIKPERTIIWDPFLQYNALDIHEYGVVTGRFSSRPEGIISGRALNPSTYYAAMIEDGVIIPPRPFLSRAILKLDFKVFEERVLSHIEELKK